jgi:hypothetical protein
MAEPMAGADLRVSDVKVSQQFIDKMKALDAPLPWQSDGNEVLDANGEGVCRVQGSPGYATEIAMMIVVALNTCGSFRATRG